MADAAANVNFKTMMSSFDLGPGANSIQFQFAKLQLLLAELNKSRAMQHMDEITSEQDRAKECASVIAKARELQSNGTAPSAGDPIFGLLIPGHAACKSIQDYCKRNGIDYKRGNKDCWDYNLTSLKNHQEQLGTGTSQKMVFLQDFMGQYNSYLTGANSTIREANQLLREIAKG
jgi:hypothetical protein